VSILDSVGKKGKQVVSYLFIALNQGSRESVLQGSSWMRRLPGVRILDAVEQQRQLALLCLSSTLKRDSRIFFFKKVVGSEGATLDSVGQQTQQVVSCLFVALNGYSRVSLLQGSAK
jgi:hypothetical protein